MNLLYLWQSYTSQKTLMDSFSSLRYSTEIRGKRPLTKIVSVHSRSQLDVLVKMLLADIMMTVLYEDECGLSSWFLRIKLPATPHLITPKTWGSQGYKKTVRGRESCSEPVITTLSLRPSVCPAFIRNNHSFRDWESEWGVCSSYLLIFCFLPLLYPALSCFSFAILSSSYFYFSKPDRWERIKRGDLPKRKDRFLILIMASVCREVVKKQKYRPGEAKQ